MAFSLKDVNLPKMNKQKVIKDCYAVIFHHILLNEKIQEALKGYLASRLKHKSILNLTSSDFNNSINDMLSFCCEKPYLKLSKSDVLRRETKIITEIKKATLFRSTRDLYWKYSTSYTIDEERLKETIEYIPKDRLMTLEEVKNLFTMH